MILCVLAPVIGHARARLGECQTLSLRQGVAGPRLREGGGSPYLAVKEIQFRMEQADMAAILDVILVILSIVTWIIIIQAVLSWLVAFNVLSLQNPAVRSIWSGLERLTEPVYRPIRNMLPQMQGLDLTPLIVLLIIFFLRSVIARYGYGAVPF
jgi:YggT family protein